jgi:hypothetical protein
MITHSSPTRGPDEGPPGDVLAAPRAELDRAETAATRQLDAHRGELATVSAQLTAARAAADELHDAGGECPLCRRPLGPRDVAAATTAHGQSIAQLRQRETELRGAVTGQTQRLQNIRALISRAAQLRVPAQSSTLPSEADIATAAQNLEQARAAETRRVDRVAEAKVRRACSRSASMTRSPAKHRGATFAGKRITLHRRLLRSSSTRGDFVTVTFLRDEGPDPSSRADHRLLDTPMSQ